MNTKNSNRMIARRSPKSAKDDFPTPPWVTRALFKYVIPADWIQIGDRVLEPACGRGHMHRTIVECGFPCKGSDIYDYKKGYDVNDFISYDELIGFDWVITNPPYKLADQFFYQAVTKADVGIALLVRLNWLQGNGRWAEIFNRMPPARVAIFASRIPFTKGKVVQRASVFFQHAWVVWKLKNHRPTRLIWVPSDAQKILERKEDYK